jgi:hypothetical protein
MSSLIAESYLLKVMDNTKGIPQFSESTLSNAANVLGKADYNTTIIKAQDLRFDEDYLELGSGERVKVSHPFMKQIMGMTSLGNSQLGKMGAEKFLENTNLIIQGEGRRDFVIRTVNDTAYSITPRDKGFYNPLDHKEFLEGVAKMTELEFSEDQLWRITTHGHSLKVVATHPVRQFDVGGNDIQREGMEFRNNDGSGKMSFHYHLLRTACINSTVFPKFLSKESASNEGAASFDRFLKNSQRMFEQNKDYLLPAYAHMKNTPLSEKTFDLVYSKLSKGGSKEDLPKILSPYLVPDFYSRGHRVSMELVSGKKEYDLFNDLTHYSKKCDLKSQQKSQELAGQMLINIMKGLKDKNFRENN